MVRGIILFSILVFICCQKKNTIVYPSPLPSGVLSIFLPGIVCTDSLEFNASFSPDGKAFYFSRSKFMIFMKANMKGHNGQFPSSLLFQRKNLKNVILLFPPMEKDCITYLRRREISMTALTILISGLLSEKEVHGGHLRI